MIKNYLFTALRSIRRHQFYSIINVLGLTVGLSCALLIVTYVYHELQYDEFHEHKDRIVRAGVEYNMGGVVTKAAVSPNALLPSFQREFPEVVGGVRVISTSRAVQSAGQSLQEEQFFYADSTFFSVFSFPLLQGTSRTVLNAPQTVVITASTAEKYFGSKWSQQDVVGQTLLVGTDRTAYRIRGVMADPPVNSHIHPALVASTESLDWFQEEQWEPSNYYTYLLLSDAQAIYTLPDKIMDLARRELSYVFEAGGSVTYHLLPLTDIHLRSTMMVEAEPGGNYQYVYIFSAVAVLILLVACINYVNLTTARATYRAREVGMRKVLGAYRSQLFGQFMGEVVLITLLALVASLIFAQLLLPYFQQLAQREFTLDYLGEPWAIGSIVLLSVLVSLLAGAYPALVLSAFRPARVLKGKLSSMGAGGRLRQGLVVFQFAVSVFLIIGTLIIFRQLQFIQQRSLGYDKEHLLALPLDKIVYDQYDALKAELEKQSAIEAVTAATETLTNIRGGYGLTLAEAPDEFMMGTTGLAVHQDFLTTTELTLLAGSDFTSADVEAATRENDDDRTYAILINETAARALGFSPEEAMNQRITMIAQPSVLRGVVEDFHFKSLHTTIEPLVIFLAPEQSNTVLVRLASESNVSAALTAVESAWNKVVKHRPFEATFLDDEFDALYTAEQQAGQLFTVFAIVAIFIACLGLFGLTAFTTVQRAKEIGIRKVLGASVSSIVVLLSRDITKLVLVALLVALPVSYFLMERWLTSFAYHINVPVVGLVIAGLAALLIAWLTVGYQAARAATDNPADALQNE